MKYETLQQLAVGLLLGAMIAAFVLIGAMVESKRMETQQYKEAVADVAEDCIYTRSQLNNGIIFNADIEHCNQLVETVADNY